MRHIKTVGKSHELEIILVSAVLLYGLFWVLIGRYLPGHRERLYREPVSGIRRILVLDIDPRFPGQRNIVITDAQTIGEIMTALRSAKPYSPNHPSTRWRCTLVIGDAAGDSYVEVVETGQGGILYCKTAEGGGFIFDTLRSGSIGSVLGRAINKQPSE